MNTHQLRKNLLEKGKTEVRIEGAEIEVNTEIFTDNSIGKSINLVTISNCILRGNSFEIEGIQRENLQLRFIECSFQCDFKIADCKLLSLHLIDTKTNSNQFDIWSNTITSFYFKNRDAKTENNLEGSVDISGNTILQQINCDNLKHASGEFLFQNNILKTKARNTFVKDNKLNATFVNSQLNQADFSETNFGEEVSFDNMTLTGNEHLFNFHDCIFEKAYFNHTNFGESASFRGSFFKKTISFNRSENIQKTIMDFSGCQMDGRFNFVYSTAKSLTIKNVSFEKHVSFQNSEFDEVNFENLSFEKQAFFDDIKINNVKACNRKSLRTIKQQLQKTENRIDYNKFKSYELNAYQRELNNSEWQDKFILYLNSISSNHGLDWLKGLTFTLSIGFIFYVFYFIAELRLWDGY